VTAARVTTVGSAYHVTAEQRGAVVVHGSYMGVLPARFMAGHGPRAIVGVDCGIGLDGSGIAGLWYLEALGVPAVAADVATVHLLNGADVLARGTVSRVNDAAAGCGVAPGMTVAEAALLLATGTPAARPPEEFNVREVAGTNAAGRSIVLISSIAYALPEDRGRNVLCTGGFAGPPNILRAAPHGYICSDGGRGLDDSGLAGLDCPIAAAAVDVRTALLGDGRSTYRDGVISARNPLAAARGVRVGQRAEEAAWLLLEEDGE
jgi:hypothetical protein